MAAVKSISFAEFGEQFMDLVVTADVIAQNVRAMVNQPISIDLPSPRVTGQAHVTLNKVTRTNKGTIGKQLIFDVPLDIAINITIDLLGLYQEAYAVQATSVLEMSVRAGDLLKIIIDYTPVQPDAVHVQASGNNWLNLAQQFGDLEGQLSRNIATLINAKLEATAEQRVIDLLAIIRKDVRLVV